MVQVGIFGIVGLAIFVALVFLKVESWGARIVLFLLVGGLFVWVSPLAAMIAAAVLSVGIVIASMVPMTSRV